MILVEKYRPKSFNDKYLVKTKPMLELENRLKTTRAFPHLLFSGAPGTGKTTIAHILITELANAPDTRFTDICLELNASDTCRIDDVRTKIKDYAKVKGLYTDKKFIFLDEADKITNDAQHALRRIMEDYSDRCMFILSCNYPSKIIQPIISRCSHYEFPKPNIKDIVPVIINIVKEEKINIEDSAIEEVVKQTNCDIREVINWIDGHSGNLSITLEDVKIINTSNEIFNIIDSNNNKEVIFNKLQDIIVVSQPKEVIRSMLIEVNKRYMSMPYYVQLIEKLAETHYRILSMSQTDGQLQLYQFCVLLYNMATINKTAKVLKAIYDLTANTTNNVDNDKKGEWSF